MAILQIGHTGPQAAILPDLLSLHQIRFSIKSIFIEGVTNPFIIPCIMTIFLVFSGASCHNKTINV